MMNYLKQLVTESDNSTADTVRLVAVASAVTFLALSIYHYGWLSEKFDPQTFGIGLGSMLAAFGAAIMLKDKEK